MNVALPIWDKRLSPVLDFTPRPPWPHTCAALPMRRKKRAYRFDRLKIRPSPEVPVLEATAGQLRFEWSHLMEKLRRRAPELALRLAPVH
jgi:hypothetical protein